MSMTDHDTPAAGIKIIGESHTGKGRIAATIAGLGGIAFASIRTLGNIIPENVFHTGIGIASVGLLYLGLENVLDRNPDPLANRRARRGVAYGAIALGSVLTFIGFRQTQEDTKAIESPTESTAPPAEVAIVSTPAQAGAEVTVITNPPLADTLPPGVCSIVAPIPEGQSDEIGEQVEVLQVYLNAEGFDAGPVDGLAPSGGQTAQAVDRLQVAHNIDPARPWDELTCSTTSLWVAEG